VDQKEAVTMTHDARPQKVLFVCVENCNRSQMAEAFARMYGAGQVEAYSAGCHPAECVHAKAIAAMKELGYDMQQHYPKGRDYLLLVISPEKGQPLVARYRDPSLLRAAIPQSDLISQLPKVPFIGELSYSDIVRIICQQGRWLSRPERILADQLNEYLEMKLATRPRRNSLEQNSSLFERDQENPLSVRSP
jgi:hypothetical protein